MSIQQQIAAGSILLSFIMFAIFPHERTSAAVVIAAIGLFGFLSFIEHENKSELEQVKAEIKALKDRIDGIQLSRGLGR